MQEKSSLEDWYKEEDPWGYRKNPDDIRRKEIILSKLRGFGQFDRALDIGAGEGFITEGLLASTIHAIEWSDNASERLPEIVERVEKPEGEYDLVIATGVLYPQYDWKTIHKWIKESASDIILTCSIKEWEIPLEGFKIVHEEEFEYGDYTQTLKLYEVAT